MEEVAPPSKAPSIKVRARDIDGMVGHLRLDGQLPNTQLRKGVEEQMARLETEVIDGLVDSLDAIAKFHAIADTHAKSRSLLDMLEERLTLIKPYLLLVMDRRSHDHFLHYVGGLRSMYLCLMEIFVAIRRVISYQTHKAKPLRQRLTPKFMTDKVQGNTITNDGEDEHPPDDFEDISPQPVKSSNSWWKLPTSYLPSFSGKSYVPLHLANTGENDPRISDHYARVFKIQLASTMSVLEHLQNQLLLMQGLWIKTDRTGLNAHQEYQFVVFRPLGEIYQHHGDIDMAAISGHHHLGYTYARSLVEYSKKLKAVYCAVAEAESWKDSFVVFNNAIFYPAAARYFLAPRLASDNYTKIRQNLDLFVQRQVWNLLEDPVIEFFATALGLNPRKLDLNADCRLLFESTIKPLMIKDPSSDSQKEAIVGSPDEKTLMLSCQFLCARDVKIDRRLYPTANSDQHETDSVFNPLRSETFRSLIRFPTLPGTRAVGNSQSNEDGLQEITRKLSMLPTSRRGYASLSDSDYDSDNPNEMSPGREFDSGNRKPSSDKFERRRNRFMDHQFGSDDSSGSEKRRLSGEFTDVPLDVSPPTSSGEASPASPRVGKIMDLDLDEESFNVLLDDQTAQNPEDLEYVGQDTHRILVTPGEGSSPDGRTSPSLADYIPVVILHVHGGGWISQSPRTHLAYLRMWAKETKLPILSIDYGLSPENEFPRALNECYAAYRWLLDPDNAQAIGLPTFDSPPRIILTGDSAGGNLCAALTIRIIREGLPRPIGLLLSYPVVLVDTLGSISRLIFSQDPILNYQSLQIVLKSYLGARSDLAKDPLVSPALVPDEILSRFPQTYIMVGDVDPLLDDSTYFFYRLREVGVPTTLQIYRRLPHGYLNLPSQLPNAPLAISDAAKFFKQIMYNDDLLRGFTVV